MTDPSLFRGHWSPHIPGAFPVPVVGHPVSYGSTSSSEHPEVATLQQSRIQQLERSLSGGFDPQAISKEWPSDVQTKQSFASVLPSNDTTNLIEQPPSSSLSRFQARCSSCQQWMQFHADPNVSGAFFSVNCSSCGAHTLVNLHPSSAIPVLGLPVDNPPHVTHASSIKSQPSGSVIPLPSASSGGYIYVPVQYQSVVISGKTGQVLSSTPNAASSVPPSQQTEPRLIEDTSWNGIVCPGIFHIVGTELTDDGNQSPCPEISIEVLEDGVVHGRAYTRMNNPFATIGKVAGMGKKQAHLILSINISASGTKSYEGHWKGSHYDGHWHSGNNPKSLPKSQKGKFVCTIKKLKYVT